MLHASIPHGGEPIRSRKRAQGQAAAAGAAARRLRLDAQYTGVFLRFILAFLKRFAEPRPFCSIPGSATVRREAKTRRARWSGCRSWRRAGAAAPGSARACSVQALACRARIFAHRRDHRVRRLRHRRAAVLGSAMAALADVPPHRVAQSNDGLAGLLAGGGHQGGAAACRSVRARHNLKSLTALAPYLARV